MLREPLRRRAVAFVGHAPALWLWYGERLPPRLVRANAIAVASTLTVMAGSWWLLHSGRVVAGVWLACHVAWGAYLAARLPPRLGVTHLGN